MQPAPARSEVPPTSKNSVLGSRSRRLPSTAAHTSATTPRRRARPAPPVRRSRAPVRSAVHRRHPRDRNRAARQLEQPGDVDLSVAGHRQPVHHRPQRRHLLRRQPVGRYARSAGSSPRRAVFRAAGRTGHDAATSRWSAGSGSPRPPRPGPPGGRAARRLDLAQLDPVAAHLDLPVAPARGSAAAAGSSHRTRSPVRYRRAGPSGRKRRRRGRSPRARPGSPSARPVAAGVQLPHRARRHQHAGLVEHAPHPCPAPGGRSAAGRRLVGRVLDVVDGGEGGVLRRPVAVGDPQPGAGARARRRTCAGGTTSPPVSSCRSAAGTPPAGRRRPAGTAPR